MDASRFDHLSKAIVSLTGRRGLIRVLAGLPLLGAASLPAGEITARRKHRDQTKKKWKKAKKRKCRGGRTRCIVGKGKRKNTICADTRWDVANCGGCGNACNGVPCIDGQCVPTCMPDPDNVICAGVCGWVENNCQQPVYCGDCECAPDSVTCASACGEVVNNCGHLVNCPYWTSRGTFGSFGAGDDQFDDPWGVAVSADGLTALIADTGNDRISVWSRPDDDADWEPQTRFGSHGSGTDQFDTPYDVAVSADGRIALISDENHRISVWTRSTTTSTDWAPQTRFGSLGSNSNQFVAPRGVAVSADGKTAWVAETLNYRISVWTQSGPGGSWIPKTQFGISSAGPSQLYLPNRVAVSADGMTALITDDTSRISVWRRSDPDGIDWEPETRFGSYGAGPDEFEYPLGIAVSADGNTAWIAAYYVSRISVWTRKDDEDSWTNHTEFGTSGSGSAQLQKPMGVALSADERTVLVADFGNNRVSVWVRKCPA
jgi:DNA-binding beta-propeller fold protein YncE